MSQALHEHLDQVISRFREAPGMLLGLDYDGTLTPIVDDPRDAILSAEVHTLLTSLAGRPNTVLSVISGRSVEDVRAMVRIPEAIFAGNHGLEINGPGFTFIEPTAQLHQQKLLALANALQPKLQLIDGAEVENKNLTLTVHYRRVATWHVDQVHRLVEAETESQLDDLRVTLGRKVIEIRPRVNWNKGHAFAWIRNRLADRRFLELFIGDDETDEDVFQTLPDAVTIKVGDPAVSSAKYFVESPKDVKEFLERLAQTRNGEGTRV